MTALYNEIDPFAAAWLQRLIAAGHLPPGTVDARSITELQPEEIPDDAHFFAGVGGWPLALRLAGWPATRPVWTGSCPCQPFSTAGARLGTADERHLWPAWFKLIAARRPPVIFAEQVASPDALRWLDAVFDDMEGAGYACGAADLCAASVGAPHRRQRLYWVAYRDGERLNRERVQLLEGGPLEPDVETAGSGEALGVAHRDGDPCDEGSPIGDGRAPGGDALEGGRPLGRGELGGVGDADRAGREGPSVGEAARDAHAGARAAGASSLDAWSSSVEWLPCSDGKTRPAQSGIHPLAHGLPIGMGRLGPWERERAEVAGLDRRSLKEAKANRIGRLRGYGNAIVPGLAAVFVRAAMDALEPRWRPP